MSHCRAALLSCVVVVAAAGGCPLDLSVPAETIISCDDNADCPQPRVCATRVGRCVDAARIDDPAITITGVDVERSRMSAIAPFNTNIVTVTTAFVPRTLDVRFDGVLLDCSNDDGDDGDDTVAVVRCAFTAPDVNVDTDAAVIVTASDDLGNVATASVGIVVDVTAPAVLPATVVSRYAGASDNPRLLDGLVAARAGTVVEVGLAFNEPCASAPEVRAVLANSDDLAFANDEGVALPAVAFFVQQTIDSSDRNGRYGIAAACVDAVGNSAAVVVADIFVVDNTAPAALDVDVDVGTDDEGNVTLLRAPWGRAVDGVFLAANARVVRGPTATDDTSLRVDVYAPALVGSGAQNADGSFDIPLLVGDVRVVEVQVVDGAGNVSARRAVRNVEWTATMGNKIVGSRFENPHTVSVTSALRPSLADPAMREVAAAPTLTNDDDAVVADAVLRWQSNSLTTTAAPQGRGLAAAAFDPVRGVVTMVGGGVALAARPEATTWLHQGDDWRALAVEAPGIAGRIASGAQDTRRDRFVVVSSTGDVVEFDGASWIAAPPLPVVNAGGALAYDPIIGRCVWIDTDSNAFTYDGNAWATIEGPAPPPRERPAFGFDDSLGGLVLFGGVGDGVIRSDTWLLSDGAWQQLDVVGPTSVGLFAEDPAGGLLLLIGTDGAGTDDFSTDVARFVDGVWDTDIVDLDSPQPPGRSGAVWVVDRISDRVIRFGGVPEFVSSGTVLPSDTWYFNGHRWRQPQAAPTVTNFSSTTDSRGTVLLLGRDVTLGGISGGVGITDAISLFTVESGWTTSFVEPRPALGHTAMARLGREVIAVDTQLGHTFHWNPTTQRFSVRNNGAPDARRAVLATLDDSTVVLVGGGSAGNETWRYDGSSWTRICRADRATVCPSSPTRELEQPTVAGLRDGFVFAYDGVAGATFLLHDDIWSPVPGPQPPPRSSPRMARLAAHDSLVLFGGANNDTWELRCPARCSVTTASWHLLPTVDSPPPHSRHGVVSLGDDVMIVGDDFFGETFVLATGNDQRPAVQVRFSIAAAGMSGDLRSIEVAATATAAGPGGTGLQLLGWQRGRFSTLDATTQTAAATLSWTAVEPQQVADALFANNQDVILAVTSDSGGVIDDVATSVALDAIELRVRYRLPAP